MRVPRLAMLFLAVVVLVAGIWWAIVMPQSFELPAEGPPIPQDETGTRIALVVLSAAAAAALVVVAYALGGCEDKN